MIANETLGARLEDLVGCLVPREVLERAQRFLAPLEEVLARSVTPTISVGPARDGNSMKPVPTMLLCWDDKQHHLELEFSLSKYGVFEIELFFRDRRRKHLSVWKSSLELIEHELGIAFRHRLEEHFLAPVAAKPVPAPVPAWPKWKRDVYLDLLVDEEIEEAKAYCPDVKISTDPTLVRKWTKKKPVPAPVKDPKSRKKKAKP
jgi:hypothetical protein